VKLADGLCWGHYSATPQTPWLVFRKAKRKGEKEIGWNKGRRGGKVMEWEEAGIREKGTPKNILAVGSRVSSGLLYPSLMKPNPRQLKGQKGWAPSSLSLRVNFICRLPLLRHRPDDSLQPDKSAQQCSVDWNWNWNKNWKMLENCNWNWLIWISQ